MQKPRLGGAIDIDIDELKKRREAEWSEDLKKIASGIQAVNSRADARQKVYDEKLKELNEQEEAKQLEEIRLKKEARAAKRDKFDATCQMQR